VAFGENREDIAALLLDYGAEPFQGKLFSNDETTPFELAITRSDGRLVARMLGQDFKHPMGTKSLQKPRRSKQTRRGMKTSAEILSRRGVELVTVAACRGELEALTALFRAKVTMRDAGTNCPTILQAYALAANDTARNFPGVNDQWHRVQDQLKGDYIPRADASFVTSLNSQESSLSNRVVMMAPERWHKILDVLVERGADYDAFAATALGDSARANKLVSRNKNVVQSRDCKGETPLHWAIRTEQPPMLALWISAGVPLDATNDAGQSALHLAASAGKAEYVKTLLAAKASTSIRDTNGWTPLDAAVQNKQADCIHLLLPENPAAGHPERGLSSSLHEAAAAGNVASLAAILETETNLEVKNELGLTPLQVAVTKGHLAAAALLADKGANVNVCDPEGNSLLHQILLQEILIIYDRPPTNWLERVGQDPGKKLYVQYLTVGQYEQGPNPLLQAASFLLASGANATAKNKAGDTPMQLIVGQKTGRGVFFFNNDRDKLLQLLTVHGGNVNEQDADGNTALHRLCTGYYDINKVESMASLIVGGANVNATNHLGQTPLHIAAQKISLWDNNDPPVNAPFQLLVYKKADVNARDNQGRTPLHVLSISDTLFKDEATRCLISAGANPNLQDNDGMTPLHLVASSSLAFIGSTVQRLLDAGANPNIQDKKGRTPAHLFLMGAWPWNSSGACLQKLAAARADFSIKDEQGKTPLHYLAALGGRQPLIFIHGVDRIFVEAKVDFQARDNDGNTPAIIAAKTETKDVFDWLVKEGADLDITNNQGETARLLMAHKNDSLPMAAPGNAETDIFQAARDGNMDAASRLLNADINASDTWGVSPLGYALIRHHKELEEFLRQHGAKENLFDAIYADDLNAATVLLEHDKTLANASTRERISAVNVAVASGRTNILRMLLKRGASIADDHAGVAAYYNQPGCLALLIRAGAKPDKPDKYGFVPLHWAAINGSTEVAELLLKHKIDVNQAVAEKDLMQSPAMGPARGTIAGDTPLHFAALCGETNMVALLLKSGADVNAANTAQMTPLDLANSMRPLSFGVSIIKRRMTGLLIPLNGQQNPAIMMQTGMTARKAAAEMLRAAGGKNSPNYSPFRRPF
jgi:ankyrin repeat protein